MSEISDIPRVRTRSVLRYAERRRRRKRICSMCVKKKMKRNETKIFNKTKIDNTGNVPKKTRAQKTTPRRSEVTTPYVPTYTCRVRAFIWFCVAFRSTHRTPRLVADRAARAGTGKIAQKKQQTHHANHYPKRLRTIAPFRRNG